MTVITTSRHLEYVSFLFLSVDVVEVWCLNVRVGALPRRQLLAWLTRPAPQTELTNAQLVLACDAGMGITLTLPGVTRHRLTRPDRDRLLRWLLTDLQ